MQTLFMRTAASRQGTALITATVLIVTMTFLAAAMTSLSVAGLKSQVDRTEKVRLMMSTETGLNCALTWLQLEYDSQIDDDSISPDLPLDQIGYDIDLNLNALQIGTFNPGNINGIANSCTITRIGVSPTNDLANDAIFLIEVIGAQGNADDANNYQRQVIEASFSPVSSDIFTQSLAAIEGYNFMGSADTDSWDSTGGAYTSGGAGLEGDVASEGDISLSGGATVNGVSDDAAATAAGYIQDNVEIPLPSFDYEAQLASASITTYPNGGTALNPEPIDEAFIDGLATIDGITGNKVFDLTSGGSPYRVSQITIGPGYELRVDGVVEIFVDGLIAINPSSMESSIIYLNSPNSSLRIYQSDYDEAADGETSWDNNGGVIGEGNPDSLPVWTSMDAHPENLIVMTEYNGTLQMNGNGVFAGVFFAPNATIKFNGTFDFFGSVLAQAFATKPLSGPDEQGKVNGSFNFHYDENLANLDLDLTPRLVMLSWRTYTLSYNSL